MGQKWKFKTGDRVIDLSKWFTPKQLAEREQLNENTIRQYLYQNKKLGKNYPIEWVYIEELGITLVRMKKEK